MFTLETKREYEVLICWACGTEIVTAAQFVQARRGDHAAFYCVNGHANYFNAKSQAELLREEKARLVSQLDQERAARATAERKLARVENGTCPHCSRSFKNLARHMKSKHAAKK